MDKQRGFTLIELLVVIAIIALLMSILMPALARVKRQAKAAICMSNLKQWGSVFTMYANSHDGYFMRGWSTRDRQKGIPAESWITSLRSYAEPKGGIACCPMAAKPKAGPQMSGSTFIPWGGPDCYSFVGGQKGDYGSYGTNSCIYNKPTKPGEEFKPEYWRRVDVKGAGNIPVFLDSTWVTAYAWHGQDPPEYEGAMFRSGAGGGGIGVFCINRHNGKINGLLMDWSVKNIRLKRLWKLKWCRDFDINALEPDWANVGTGWMAKLPD